MLNLILKQNFQNDSLLGNYKFIENFFIYLFNYYFSNKLSFYLPAGVSLFIDSKSGDNIQDWKIMIGCHSDELDINNRLDRFIRKMSYYNFKEKNDLSLKTHLIAGPKWLARKSVV